MHKESQGEGPGFSSSLKGMVTAYMISANIVEMIKKNFMSFWLVYFHIHL